MNSSEYVRHDGTGLAALVARREVSPAELVEAAIAGIERRNGALNADHVRLNCADLAATARFYRDTHVTRRVGSPYSLVLTKTRALFTQDAAERATWVRDLA